MKKNYSLATLNVYMYNSYKIKCDYSIIPVKLDETNHWKSLVSDDLFDHNLFKNYKNDLIKYSKKKEGKSCKIELIVEGDLEEIEDKTIKKLYKLFSKHFWYKFKYRKFLDKKRNLKQINF